MKKAAVLEVVYPGFHPDLDNRLRSAVGRPADFAGTAFDLWTSGVRDMGWEFQTIQQAEKAKDRVLALKLPLKILAYIHTPTARRYDDAGAQDPAAA